MITISLLCILAAVLLSTNAQYGLAFAASTSPTKTIVVTGATGRTGSRLVQELLKDERNNSSVHTIALVRNATKARFMLGDDNDSLTIVEADFDNVSSLEAAFSTIKSNDLRLFLACGNVADQDVLEMNVAHAAKAMDKNCYCVKLSTAEPLVENSIGPGKVHKKIEGQLTELFSDCCTMLRPNLFTQMLDISEGGALLGIDLQDNSMCGHIFSDSAISMIDADDVASCAASILVSENPKEHHGGKVYELTGPEAVTLSGKFANAVSSLRPVSISVQPWSVEEQVVSAGMPVQATERIAPFLNTIRSYSTVTDTVPKLTGRPAKSVSEFVYKNSRAFLPKTFRRVIATGRASSFREAAKVITASLDTDIGTMDDDEVLIRVQVAGVNGGADTFGVTRASDEAKDFPLGNEGAGIVVLCGRNVTCFQPGDTAVFVANGGYGQYVRAKAARCAAVPAESKATPFELTSLRISALTALVALQRTCPVKSKDVVLVTACCGGTGHFAAQIAKNAGATVIGTVGSTAKVEHAKALGVDRVVDLSKENLEDVLKEEYSKGIDLAYEGVGGKLLNAVFENLAEGGRILIVGSISQYPHNRKEDVELHNIEGLGDIMQVFRSGQTVELGQGKKIVGNVWGGIFGSGEMNQYRDLVFDLHSKGHLRVLLDPDNEFIGLNSVCDAVEYMLSRRSIGKVCVKVSD